MSNLTNRQSMYIEMCINYRTIALILSTFSYLSMFDNLTQIEGHIGIILGMIFSYFLSVFLYQKIGENTTMLRIMFVMENFAYGIFILMSGGIYSPYLWYQVGCILLMIVLEKYISVTIIASLWCLSCAIVGEQKLAFYNYKLNIFFGVLMLLAGFYILRFYVHYIKNQGLLLSHSNAELEKEKVQSEFAFSQLANIYQTLNLFGMVDSDKIISELSTLIRKAIASRGCILLKFDNQEKIEYYLNSGIDEAHVEYLIDEVLFNQNGINGVDWRQNIPITIEDCTYELKLIGEHSDQRGAVIRYASDCNQKNEKFYWQLIDIIFTNLDTYGQIENFIIQEEQNRIANEIHDIIIQKLFGVICTLKILEINAKNLSEDELTTHITTLKTSVESIMAELRQTIYGNRFKENIKTLTEMLSSYMIEVEQLTNASITIDIDKDTSFLTVAQQVAMYRICCEAVNNAIRHGSATKATITLKCQENYFRLIICDNGSGFDRYHTNFVEGNGLRNMRNITSLLKGKLNITSSKEGGTEIRLTLPR